MQGQLKHAAGARLRERARGVGTEAGADTGRHTEEEVLRFLCASIYLSVCVHICVYVHIHMYICKFVYMYTYIHLYERVRVCERARVYVCVCVFVCVCAHVCMCMCVCLCMYAYVSLSTYEHLIFSSTIRSSGASTTTKSVDDLLYPSSTPSLARPSFFLLFLLLPGTLKTTRRRCRRVSDADNTDTLSTKVTSDGNICEVKGHTHTHTSTHTHTHKHTHAHARTHAHACTHAHTQTIQLCV